MFSQTNFFKDVKPLFILGVPRSGTTFLQQVINAHPEVLVTDELRVISWMFKEAKKLKQGFEVHGDPYPFNNGKELGDYLLNNCGTLLAPFYYQQAQKLGKTNLKYWGDKYPHYNEVMEQMCKSFPRARYIFIYRELRDVICSVRNGHQWTVEKSATYVCNIYEQYMKAIKKLIEQEILDSTNITYLDYISLNVNIERVAEAVFNNLGLDFPEVCKENVIKLSQIQSHSNRKPGKKTMKFNIENSAGRWKQELTDEEKKVVNQKIEQISEMIEYGASLSKSLVPQS